MNAFIMYGTRGGWTKKTAEVISEVLKGKGYKVEVSKHKPKEVAAYDVIIVGSSIMAGLWTFGTKGFVKKQGNKVKKLCVFVSAGGVMNSVKDGKTKEEAVQNAVERYIDPLRNKYSIRMDKTGAFGGQFGKGDKIKFNNWCKEDIIEWASGI